MDVLSALEVLRNVPSDVLLAHGHEAILILREVEQRIAERLPTSLERVSPLCRFCHRPGVSSEAYKTMANSSSYPITRRRQSTSTSNSPPSVTLDLVYSPPRPVQTPTASSEPSARLSSKRKNSARRQHKDPADQVTALLNSIIEAVPWMLELCKNRPAKLVRARQSRRKNRRLEDIRRVEGDEKASNTDKLFRGVAQRSLSLQFVAVRKSSVNVGNGARSCDGVSRTDERSLIQYGRGGGISKFVRDNSDIEADDEQFAIQCIRAGNKQLEVERVLSIKMKDAGRAGKVSAISALTALPIRRFRYLNLTAIPQFVESLFKESSKIDLPREGKEKSTSLHILDVIEQMSQWFETLQQYYDSYVPRMQEVQVPSPGRARTLSSTGTSEAAQSSDGEVEGTNVCRSGFMESSPESGNTVFETPPPSSPSQGRSGSITSSLSDPSPSSHRNTVSPRKRRRKNVPKPRSSGNTRPRQNPTQATEPIPESGFSIRRDLPAEFSGSHRTAELLSPQNYAQAFDHPFQPAGGNLVSENAFREPNNVQPGFHGRYACHGLDDQNYARAFDHPFQPAAGSPISENTFREADNVQPGFHGRYACHGLDDHNYARAFDCPIRFTPTPENSGREAGGLDFTADSLEHRPSNDHPSQFGAGGIRPTTEPAVHRALNEHCQRIADEIWSYQGIAQSFGPDTIQLIGEPHTAPLVA